MSHTCTHRYTNNTRRLSSHDSETKINVNNIRRRRVFLSPLRDQTIIIIESLIFIFRFRVVSKYDTEYDVSDDVLAAIHVLFIAFITIQYTKTQIKQQQTKHISRFCYLFTNTPPLPPLYVQTHTHIQAYTHNRRAGRLTNLGTRARLFGNARTYTRTHPNGTRTMIDDRKFRRKRRMVAKMEKKWNVKK